MSSADKRALAWLLIILSVVVVLVLNLLVDYHMWRLSVSSPYG